MSFPKCVRFAVSAALCFPGIAHSQTPATQTASSASAGVDRVTGWKSDIAFWLEQLRKQHYVYKSKPLPAALVKGADELTRNIPKYSDERMLFEMQRLAAYI